ncbi:MAG: HugZ family protein [Opitutales bacterium]
MTRTAASSSHPVAEPAPNATDALHRSYRELIDGAKTLTLGTADAQGEPHASYAPFFRDAAGDFHVFVSDLAEHAGNLRDTGRASVMIIEDEAAAEHLSARRRATFACRAVPVERDTDDWNTRMDAFQAVQGEGIGRLRKLLDFTLYRLVPEHGRVVLGFGQAFKVSPEDWSVLQRLPEARGGHKRQPGHRAR